MGNDEESRTERNWCFQFQLKAAETDLVIKKAETSSEPRPVINGFMIPDIYQRLSLAVCAVSITQLKHHWL